MREIDEKALLASQNAEVMEGFLLEFESYVLKCASKTAKRYVTKSDDEWAIAMEAFYSAVKGYSYEKGSFLSFAALVINRRLIDYFRRQKSIHGSEFPVSPDLFSGEINEEEGEDFLLAGRIATQTAKSREDSLKDEIDAANGQFAPYDFSFYDLVDCSPKSKKTKKACAQAVNFLIENPPLCREMQRMRVLPLKTIEAEARVPRKILERHRRYIIAATEILMGDFPFLSEYMRSCREEQSK